MIWLVFAHYFGDIAFQNEWQAMNKGKLWYVMLSHCMIWAGCICIALEFLGLMAPWKPVFLVAGHWVMDQWKASKPRIPGTWKYIYPDQVWHLVQCFIVWRW